MNKAEISEKIKNISENIKSFWKQNSTNLAISIIVSVVTLFLTALANSDTSFFVYVGIIYLFLALFFSNNIKLYLTNDLQK